MEMNEAHSTYACLWYTISTRYKSIHTHNYNNIIGICIHNTGIGSNFEVEGLNNPVCSQLPVPGRKQPMRGRVQERDVPPPAESSKNSMSLNPEISLDFASLAMHRDAYYTQIY